MTKRFLLGLLTAGLLAPGILLAQTQPVTVKAGDGVDVKDVKFEVQKTPEFQPGNVKSKSFKPRDWLEVEVEFEVKGVNIRDAVVPKLLFRYYVALQDKEGGTRVLSGDINHVNILSGEEMYSAAYISPGTLGKVTGDYRRFQASGIKAVGVEIFFNGVSVGGQSSAGGKFWTTLSPEPGVLSKIKTPFRDLWLDRYADFEDSN